ncbi:putative amino-acid metabolite efflux pump [Bacteroidales bacterium Barb6]|nr:putative amino-acid metabolite efflux pump [Bacteroidales bacterium Barb6]
MTAPKASGRTFIYHAIAIFTAVVWGATFVSTKVLLGNGLTPAEIFLYRFILAYAGIRIVSRQKLWADSRRDELLLAAAGVTGGSLYFLFENTALGITLASNVSLIVCTAPVMTAFLIRLFHKEERVGTKRIGGSLIALAGVGLVVFNGHFILKISPLGDTLSTLAALMWAFYGLILKRLDTRYPVMFITRKVFAYGLLTLLPYFLFKPPATDWHTLLRPIVLSNLLFLGLLASMLCYILWNTAVKELGAVRTSVYIYLQPPVTLLTSAMIIREQITPVALAGSALIIGGVWLSERKSDVAQMP